jgi:hypothetical protein
MKPFTFGSLLIALTVTPTSAQTPGWPPTALERAVATNPELFPVAIRVVTAFSTAVAQGQTKPSEKIDMDGSKNPQMIPRWVIWRNVFRVVNHLSSPNSRDPRSPYEQLDVSREDWNVILAEAKHQAEQEAQKTKEYEPIIQNLQAQKKTVREILAALAPFELAERWEYLAGGDRLMEKLSPESAVRLQRWIDEMIVRGFRMTMARYEYEHFRKPM